MSTPQLSLKHAPASTLDLLVERPELAVVFWMDPDYVPPKQPGWVKWVARQLGGYTPPTELPEPPPELDRTGAVLRIDEGPHAIGDEAATILLSSGKPIEGSTHGHGDERAVYTEQVTLLIEHLGGPSAGNRPLAQLQTYLNAAVEESLGVVVKLS